MSIVNYNKDFLINFRSKKLNLINKLFIFIKINCHQTEDPQLIILSFIPAESDFTTFLQIKNHFKTDYKITTNLFTVQTRTETLQKMYDAAAKTPVPAIQAMDDLIGIRGRRSSDAFICTPILERTRRRMKNKVDIEIETRMVS